MSIHVEVTDLPRVGYCPVRWGLLIQSRKDFLEWEMSIFCQLITVKSRFIQLSDFNFCDIANFFGALWINLQNKVLKIVNILRFSWSFFSSQKIDRIEISLYYHMSDSFDSIDDSPKLDFLHCLFSFTQTLPLQKFQLNLSLEFA